MSPHHYLVYLFRLSEITHWFLLYFCYRSTGIKIRIQMTPETASLLTAAGQSHWVNPREDQVNAKGKGVLNPFWLHINSTGPDTASSSGGDVESNGPSTVTVPNSRFIGVKSLSLQMLRVKITHVI
jgi:hypothetical protein